MTKAPFYGVRLWPKVHHCMGGVKTDVDCRVLDMNLEVIPGLYAAGEGAGGIHGACRLGSCATADCLVNGRIAGQKAAAEAWRINPHYSLLVACVPLAWPLNCAGQGVRHSAHSVQRARPASPLPWRVLRCVGAGFPAFVRAASWLLCKTPGKRCSPRECEGSCG